MERTRGFSTLTKRFDEVFPRAARRGVAAPTALLRGKGGILFGKRIPPLKPPEKGEGSPPRPPHWQSGAWRTARAAQSGACCFLYLNDLVYFYYPLPLFLRVGSLPQSLSTLDSIDLAGAYQGGIASLAAFVVTVGRRW